MYHFFCFMYWINLQFNCFWNLGKGKKVMPGNSWFSGMFHNGELEGHGTFHWPDGTQTKQRQKHIFKTKSTFWLQKKSSNMCFFADKKGTEFEGLWEHSEIIGPGCHRFPNGTLFYHIKSEILFKYNRRLIWQCYQYVFRYNDNGRVSRSWRFRWRHQNLEERVNHFNQFDFWIWFA